MKPNTPAERLYNGLIKENPTFVLMLGMCPTLAITTSATNGARFSSAANLTAIHAGGLTPQAVALMHSAAAAPTTRKWRTAYHRQNAKNRFICLI